LGGTTTYTYDNIGQIIAVEDALGGVSTSEYDADDRNTQNSSELAEEGSDTHRVSYEYDAMGRVTKLTNEDGTFETYTYDENGNLLSSADENGHTTTYTYDKNNNVLTATDPMGGVTTYTYSETGMVRSETDALGNVTK